METEGTEQKLKLNLILACFYIQ